MQQPNFKVIHIGRIIEQKVIEREIDMIRISAFLKTRKKKFCQCIK